MVEVLRPTQQDLVMARTACYGVAAGSTTRGAAGRLLATTARRRTALRGCPLAEREAVRDILEHVEVDRGGAA